ncbi:bifunctional phosphopantothenoylcysteine decarboxylase/phosphopantothenate--cysteine ligase CoaBC, partial [Thermodesulfobacteriota bacterium]
AKLKERGVSFVGPVSGELACKKEDIGRLSYVDDIVYEIISRISKKTLSGKNVLVTAGPTVEQIDPVRFISNRSSGKMGYALARMAKMRGANVTLISGPVKLDEVSGVNTLHVRSASDMHEAVNNNFNKCDVLIMTAACADFTVAEYSKSKIKKDGVGELTLNLKRTTDILSEVKKLKGDRIVVGFAAESDNIEASAIKKLKAKGLNFIVANDITKEDAGFESDTNIATIIDSTERAVHYDIMTKDELSEIIIDKISGMLNSL